MDMMSMVGSLLAMQAGGVQSQIGAAIIKSNADTEKSAVLTLLGAAQQSSQANLAAGVGGSIDVTA
jgi:Putative motility protein